MRKRRLHRFYGAEVPHFVEKFKGERLYVVLFTAKPKAYEKMGAVFEGPDGCDCREETVEAIKKSYRNVGKREKQEELFPMLKGDRGETTGTSSWG